VRIHDGTDLRGIGLKQGCGFGDLNRRRYIPDLQTNIDARHLIQHQSDLPFECRLKTGMLHFQVVGAGRDAGKIVGAFVVGDSGPGGSAIGISRSDLRGRDARAGRIGDAAGDGCGNFLGP
jgi:hypothetical protein